MMIPPFRVAGPAMPQRNNVRFVQILEYIQKERITMIICVRFSGRTSYRTVLYVLSISPRYSLAENIRLLFRITQSFANDI